MSPDHEADTVVSPQVALERLMAGNERFVRGEPNLAHPPREVLANLARAQRPFATILGCSDSRVPPELLFDAAFGDLFIIRVAGNLMSPSVAGSLQYAGTHLGTRLFMVLGHEGCGAVQAALAGARAFASVRASMRCSRTFSRGWKASTRNSRRNG